MSVVCEEASPGLLPKYEGGDWLPAGLPISVRDWSHGGEKSLFSDTGQMDELIATLGELNENAAWRWPSQPHYFLSDLHGDAEAFIASLVASGGIRMHGSGPGDWELTERGKQGCFIIGGDCFDKGPSSLELLRTIKCFSDQGGCVRLLAGNHDVRVLLGMMAVGPEKDVRNEHFFIRTGKKIIPLLREVWDQYLAGGDGLKDIPGKKECRKRLFPRDSWFEEFAARASNQISIRMRQRELKKISKKLKEFEKKCAKAGLNLRQVYAAVEKWKELFLEEEGEFSWFFRDLELCLQSGSFLFIHAGVDDCLVELLVREGAEEINRRFRKAMAEFPFDFYYGPLCNGIRTKYREVDHPLTPVGVRGLKSAGVAAVIHGHRNLHNGQRISFRNSIISFECDTSLDRHTREVEKIEGAGASVTIVDPAGHIIGVSSDYPHAKVFHPEATWHHLRSGIGS